MPTLVPAIGCCERASVGHLAPDVGRDDRRPRASAWPLGEERGDGAAERVAALVAGGGEQRRDLTLDVEVEILDGLGVNLVDDRRVGALDDDPGDRAGPIPTQDVRRLRADHDLRRVRVVVDGGGPVAVRPGRPLRLVDRQADARERPALKICKAAAASACRRCTFRSYCGGSSPETSVEMLSVSAASSKRRASCSPCCARTMKLTSSPQLSSRAGRSAPAMMTGAAADASCMVPPSGSAGGAGSVSGSTSSSVWSGFGSGSTGSSGSGSSASAATRVTVAPVEGAERDERHVDEAAADDVVNAGDDLDLDRVDANRERAARAARRLHQRRVAGRRRVDPETAERAALGPSTSSASTPSGAERSWSSRSGVRARACSSEPGTETPLLAADDARPRHRGRSTPSIVRASRSATSDVHLELE